MEMRPQYERNSMMHWWPRLYKLGLPMPETRVLPTKSNTWELVEWVEGRINNPIVMEIEAMKIYGEKFGYPLFIRTDHFSGKHWWKETCFVENAFNLEKNLVRLIEESFCAQMMEPLPIGAFIVRKYIEMDNLFSGFFAEMPVNPEIRCFIKDGKLICHHWYWVEKAVESGGKKYLPENWRKILQNARRRTKKEVESTVLPAAKHIAKEFKGFWSVDFCRGKDGTWYVIDMALGHNSWHPEECKNAPWSNKKMEDENEQEEIRGISSGN